MASSGVLSTSAQNQHQHPFLFQQHQYSSGDDGDSPPSLTNSSESPRSISEEGDNTSLGQFDLFDASQEQKSMPQGNNRNATQFDMTKDAIEGDDSIMSPVQPAASPNWDSVFASATNNDEMDLSTPVTAPDPKQQAQTPMHSRGASTNESILANGRLNGVSTKVEEKWPTNSFSAGLAAFAADIDTSNMTDEAMFESLIQEDSFDNSGTSSKLAELTNGNSTTQNLATDMADSTPVPPTATPLPSSVLISNSPPAGTIASMSAVSSRRNSNENEQGKQIPRLPHCGSHYSHTSDADLPTSSQVVVRPPRAELNGLQVHVHGIAFTGAKSRVETQIRTRIELVRPVATGIQATKAGTGSPTQFERIGSFNHVKLPPLTGTKRKSKKHKPNDIAAETTLFMDATVVRATPPHERVLVCASCQQRERKRAQRKRTGSSGKKGDVEKAIDDDSFSVEELNEYGIDPNAADAQEQARQRASLEDEKRVVVFNCGDFINFEDGACVLPTRITCYCRHHKEKTGFCLIFTMRDYRGNLVATGSTPPIMITDDHKSVAAAQAAAANASGQKKNVSTRSRGTSTDNLEEGTNIRSIGKDSFKKKRSHRAKPYGDADDRAHSRRNTISSNTMTPFTSTGQNTPAAGNSPLPQTDMNHPDFWNSFAALSTLSQSPRAGSSHASNGAHTPHDALSPMAQQVSPIQQQSNTGGQEWLANMSNQGSISSQTLNLCPQSLPGFDLDAFSRSLQQSSQQDEATMQHLYMLARSLPGVDHTSSQNAMIQSGPNDSSSLLPVPMISKLIPGEGPTSGGIEVTVLGENFTDNLTCLFGDVPATSTKVWGSNTLLCVLPPSASPGPVAVSIKRPGDNSNQLSLNQDRYGRSLQLFTYVDTNDRALMELALQVVGLQMTGQMQTARDVAMRVVGSGSNGGISHNQIRNSSSSQQQMRNAVSGMFAGGQSNQSFQNSVLQFFTTLDEPVGSQRRDAIRLANKQGHTLLHLTVILGFHRLALNLIQRGCPMNARDHNGYTALHFAALHGRMTIARMLLNHGARFDVECEAGKYPIDVAREREQVDIEILLEEGMEEKFSDEEDDESSDWTTDEEEIDADNISTQAEDSIVGHTTDDGADVAQIKSELAKRDHISPSGTGQSTPKADIKGKIFSEKFSQEENEKKVMEAKTSGLKGLVSGGIDFAQKWPIGMPTVLHDRLNLMHMPTVSVFQMVLPPNFMSWAGQNEASSSGATPSIEKQKEQEEADSRQETSEERFKALTMWRNIIEESAMWINPLYSPPPPTYESALHAKGSIPTTDGQSEDNRISRSGISSKRATSRFPAIAQPSPDSPHKNPPRELEVDSRRSSSRPDFFDKSTRSASWPSNRRSLNKSSLSRNGKSASTISLLGATTTLNSSSSNKLREDPMLVYFWLPALIFVILLLCFTKPSSVLSYKDLISFMPVR